MPVPRFDRLTMDSGDFSGYFHTEKRTNKNILVKIICNREDVMHETPERDVFY
jgi:hypothetical protein